MHGREAAQLLDALEEPGPSVISAAASVVDDPACRAAMVGPGVAVIWLHAEPALLATRFDSADEHRPAYGPSRRGVPGRPGRANASRWLPADRRPRHRRRPPDARRGGRAGDRGARLASSHDRTNGPHPRCRHRHRRQPRAALRRGLARRRARRRDLRVGQHRRRARSRSTRGPSSSSPAGPTSRSRSGARPRCVRALETTPETHGPQGLGHAELPPPIAPALDAPRASTSSSRRPAAGPARSRWSRSAR